MNPHNSSRTTLADTSCGPTAIDVNASPAVWQAAARSMPMQWFEQGVSPNKRPTEEERRCGKRETIVRVTRNAVGTYGFYLNRQESESQGRRTRHSSRRNKPEHTETRSAFGINTRRELMGALADTQAPHTATRSGTTATNAHTTSTSDGRDVGWMQADTSAEACGPPLDR